MKRVRDTSAECYRELQLTLSRREQAVLDALERWQGDPPTGYELTEALKQVHAAFDVNSCRPRLTALFDKGLVDRVTKRRCRITGRTAYTWRVAVPEFADPPVQQELSL